MKYQPVTEGISYNATDNSFCFDFQGNGEYSIIEFNDLPLEPVKFGINSVYYFGYQFSNNDAATSQVRTKFFNALRYGTIVLPKEAKQQFILNALDKLNEQINIWSFDVLVCPESRSTLNAQIIDTLTNFVNFKSIPTITLAKNSPKNITFDWLKWERYMNAETVNGKPIFVNDAAKQNAIKSINALLDKIHNADYFSIAETVKKNKYKKYIKDYLIANNDDTDNIINAKNILLIDDVSTTGATIMEALKAIRCLNQTAKIVIFTLVGKKDLG